MAGSNVTLGLLFDTGKVFEPIVMGPPADSNEVIIYCSLCCFHFILSLSLSQAIAFRSFWGERSELRRFPDGSINEAVLWTKEEGEGEAEKRNVPRRIIEHVIRRHAHLEGAILTHNILDSVLSFGKRCVLSHVIKMTSFPV